MTMLHAFVSFMLVASTSAIYNIQGNLMCGGTKTIAAEDAADDVWVQLYYMERDTLQTYCTPFHVGGHEYDSADKYFFSASKGLECINECILYDNVTGDAIRAVTFYHSGANLACYCIKDTHYDTTAGMSTCNFKYTNDYMEVKRAKHDSRVPFSGKQMISLDNDNNFIHLEGAAGRTDNALMLMVKVTNAQCNTAPPAGTLSKTLTSKQDDFHEIESTDSIIMGMTDKGGWWDPKYCKDGVIGFRLRVEPFQGDWYDDSSLNGIQLRCWSGSHTDGLAGYRGEWKGWKVCNHGTHIISFQLQSEGNPNAYDATGANNVRMKCSDGKELDGEGLFGGHWEPYKSCATGSYFCGVRVKIQDLQGSGDDSALNKMEFLCCRAPALPGDVDLGRLVPVGTITVKDVGQEQDIQGREMRIHTRADNTGMWATCNSFRYTHGIEKTLRCNKRTMARYVRIARDFIQTFYFTVKVTEAKPSMAFKKPAKQGTPVTEVTSSTHEAGKAVDGIYKDTYAHTSTFWRVDLKELITIDKIILYLDRDFYRSEPYNGMKVLTSRWNLDKWTLCKNVGAELTFPADGDRIVRTEVTCLETTIARAVRIENGVVRLHELEVVEANAVWFNTPYNCFDDITPQFGCKDLIFDLSTGEVRKDEAAAAAAAAKEADRRAAEGPVYYKIWNKMLDGEFYAGYDSARGDRANRGRHARVHSRIVADPDYAAISQNPNIFLWELVNAGKKDGKDYYNIISKDTNGQIQVNDYKTQFDHRPERKTDHYATIRKSRSNGQADKELWEIVKGADAYYTIVNKKFAHPLFAEHVTRVADINDNNYQTNGKEIWDLKTQ